MTTLQPTAAYLSQIGHYNFHYPNFAQSIVIDAGAKLTRLPWSIQKEHVPFLMTTAVGVVVVWIKI